MAIKQPNGKVKFFGGKTNPIEKRTRVRARVISHALKELITASDKVIIMGHKNPDMDSIGSAIGIYKVAQMNQKDAYIVVNLQEIDSAVSKINGRNSSARTVIFSLYWGRRSFGDCNRKNLACGC